MNANNSISASPYAVPETINRLAVVLQAKGTTIFARIVQQMEG